MADLQKPLYLFDLPKAILDSLKVKGQQIHTVEPTEEPKVVEENLNPSTSSATSCNLCNAKFSNVQEQRQHVKSDFHKYNLKQRLKGLTAVTETEFEKLLEDFNESISGSDDSDAESDGGDEGGSSANMLNALLKKQAKISEAEDPVSGKSHVGSGNPPLIWLESPSLPENTSLGVYRVLFSTKEQEDVAEIIRQKQLGPVSVAKTPKHKPAVLTSKSPTYFLCMIGGGHFAAMVVALAPKMATKHNDGSERQAIVLAHKGFHKYTTRRKQGGSQSSNDAAKGAAHSAGAQIRRANEVALVTDIRALLSEWKSLINDCELVFVRATGSSNRRTLFGPYDGQVLSSKDVRNRGFPFSTRRATQTELMRAFVELTRVKVSHIDEAAILAAEEARKAAIEANQPKPKQAPKQTPKPSPEEEAHLLHISQITSLIKRSKIPGLLSYIKTNAIDINQFTLLPESQYHHTPSILHYASSIGSAAVVTSLLTKCNASPLLKNEEGKTASDVAKDRGVRDAFRTARHELGEGAFDWDTAGVGSALTPDEANARASKEREAVDADAQAEAERRKLATQRLREQDMVQEEVRAEKKFGKGYSVTGAEKREQDMRGMAPEIRARVERERRARAAEERMKRLQGSS